jgi:hypothetical protein
MVRVAENLICNRIPGRHFGFPTSWPVSLCLDPACSSRLLRGDFLERRRSPELHPPLAAVFGIGRESQVFTIGGKQEGIGVLEVSDVELPVWAGEFTLETLWVIGFRWVGHAADGQNRFGFVAEC